MENQKKIITINVKDLKRTIDYLKDYSTMIGKFYNQTTIIETKQQFAYLNLNVNDLIKKLEKEI